MKEKEVFRIKQYFIWIGLLARRLLRQPAYIGLLLLIPVAGGAVGLLERSAGGGAVAAVCAEQGSWSSDIVASLQEQAADSVLRFTFCEDREQAKELVLLEEADCGFVIPADIEERVLQGEYEQCIAVYETAASSITGMAKERIAGVLFRLYSEYRYAAYMEQTAPEAVGYAMEAYAEHLSDESTFDFRYFYHDPNSQNIADTGDGNDTIVKAAVFPVKGVFAVLIFVAGMCGMLEYEKDKKEKRFMRIAPNALTYLVDVWISTVFVSGAVLICLWITEGLRGQLYSGRHGCGVERGDVAAAGGPPAALPVYRHRILCYTQGTAAQTGDDSGGDPGTHTGKPAVRAGLYPSGKLSAGFCSAGETVSCQLLSAAVMMKRQINCCDCKKIK